MSEQFLILSAGRDADLLRSRNALLKAHGCTVVAAHNTLELIDKYFSGDFDMVIVCHSIPLNERQRISALVRRHSPSTPIISVGTEDEISRPGIHDIAGDPASLLIGIAGARARYHQRAS